MMTELLAATLDMNWHTVSNGFQTDFSFENKHTRKYGLLVNEAYKIPYPYFAHIYQGGYSAGYYAYTFKTLD
jgi:peptidyl-dipeptidase Dcp